MKPCVYTTQHSGWLTSALARDHDDLICFRSARRWASAARLLNRHGQLPILFRKQDDDSDPVLTCRFVAELTEVRFIDEFETNAHRLAWLDDKLWFQREVLKRKWQTNHFPTWESQYKTWEIDKFMAAKTWYIVRSLQEIAPLPLPRLRKLNGDHPLAPNFVRGYALCHYPENEIRLKARAATAVRPTSPPKSQASCE